MDRRVLREPPETPPGPRLRSNYRIFNISRRALLGTAAFAVCVAVGLVGQLVGTRGRHARHFIVRIVCCSKLDFALALGGTMLVPTKRKDEDLAEAYEEHHQCESDTCARCRFGNGMHGRLRKGSKTIGPDSPTLAWKSRFRFNDIQLGQNTWLWARPRSWGGAWACGCYLAGKDAVRPSCCAERGYGPVLCF